MAAEGMPAPLLELFAPRPPLEFVKLPDRRKSIAIKGLSEYVALFADDKPPPPTPFETPKERRLRVKREQAEAHKQKLKQLTAEYDPHGDPKTTRDPYATLFVGRISYETTEKKIKREFEVYGSIRKIRMVTDKNSKPRGYAFIEYDNERDMKEAYKHADGKKVDGKRVLVDVERGRTVQNWLPRRLGGGRGPPRFVVAKPKRSAVGGISTANSTVGRNAAPPSQHYGSMANAVPPPHHYNQSSYHGGGRPLGGSSMGGSRGPRTPYRGSSMRTGPPGQGGEGGPPSGGADSYRSSNYTPRSSRGYGSDNYSRDHRDKRNRSRSRGREDRHEQSSHNHSSGSHGVDSARHSSGYRDRY